MGDMNCISNGKCYIYKKNDIYAIYKLLKEFYKDTLIPLFGESDSCDFEYDKDLQVVKIRKYGKGKNYKRGKRLIYLYEDTELYNRVYLLLESIAATGIVSAPFYSIRVTFNTNLGHTICVSSNSLLTYKGCLGNNTGYYKLTGHIL